MKDDASGPERKEGTTVDPAGAEKLRWRLEQQAHWRQAEAVCDGRQPAVDPDSDDLERYEDGVRIYGALMVHGQLVQPCKELRDGVWVSGVLRGPAADRANDREQVAAVA